MKLVLLLVTISALLIFGSAQVFAQSDCHTAIKERVIQKNPQVEKVTFDQDSETKETTVGKGMEMIKGNGQFLRHTGKWEDITWTCSFDTKSNRVATAEYSVVPTNHPTREADVSKGWAKDCQDGVRSQVQTDHSNAEKIVFKTALESQYFKSDKLLEGDGFFQRKDGVKKDFSYWCIFNTRTDKIVDKNYAAQ